MVLDVGSGIVTCAGVLEGRELPGALSCLPPEASVSKLVDMVHTVTLACEESARVKLQVSIVITGMVCMFDCVECVCIVKSYPRRKPLHCQEFSTYSSMTAYTYYLHFHGGGNKTSNCLDTKIILIRHLY